MRASSIFQPENVRDLHLDDPSDEQLDRVGSMTPVDLRQVPRHDGHVVPGNRAAAALEIEQAESRAGIACGIPEDPETTERRQQGKVLRALWPTHACTIP